MARWALVLLGAVALGLASRPMAPAIVILAVSVLVLLLAVGRTEADKRLLLSVGCAIVVFGLYRFAIQGIAPVWMLSDALGRLLGRTPSLLGLPLSVGATYGGLDFLALTLAFLLFSCLYLPVGWKRRLTLGLLFTVLGHGLYLVVLASSEAVLAKLPVPPEEELGFSVLPAWSLLKALRFGIPWYMPLVALLIYLVTNGWLLRAALRAGRGFERPGEPAGVGQTRATPALPGWPLAATAAVLALALPLVIMWPTGRSTLEGKKIVAYEKGFLNWLKPKHGDYGRFSVGMYGMLPEYLASMGAQCKISPELSEEDLRGADLLIMFYPNEVWKEGQLERIWNFVRQGGSLLVCGEHTVHEEGGTNRFNEVIAPTGIKVNFDSSEFLIGGWLQSYQTHLHPTNAGIADERNQFGAVIGASVQMPLWGAQPLLIGRWGWNDPGDLANDPSLMGNRKYDPGEPLGDIVLAAETRLGKGKVIVFGDTSGMTNGIMPGAYLYTSRLMAYLASPGARTARTLQTVLALVLWAALALILFARLSPQHVLPVPVLLAVSLSFFTHVAARSIGEVPDGRRQTPNNLALIDAAHLSAASDESWRDEGTAGLNMTLTRCGYLALNLPEFTRERLEKAGLLVTIAPSKFYSRQEKAILRDFVSNGGILIMTVGVEDPRREAALDLAAEYDLYVGDRFFKGDGYPPAPEPFGHFKAPYLNTGEYMCYVRFWAGWPILCRDPKLKHRDPAEQKPHPDASAIAYGRGDRNVILLRKYGKGQVVFVGDTYFATNKNLERIDGSPFEGMRENQEFWRWLLSLLNRQELYTPPDPKAASPPALLDVMPAIELPPVESQPSDVAVPATQEGTP